MLGQQRAERRQLLVEIVVPARVEIERNKSCFHDVVLFTGVMVGWPAVQRLEPVHAAQSRAHALERPPAARAICSSSHGSATVLKSNIPK